MVNTGFIPNTARGFIHVSGSKSKPVAEPVAILEITRTPVIATSLSRRLESESEELNSASERHSQSNNHFSSIAFEAKLMSSDLGLSASGMFSSHGFNLSVTFELLIWRWNVGEYGQSKWRGPASELLDKNPR